MIEIQELPSDNMRYNSHDEHFFTLPTLQIQNILFTDFPQCHLTISDIKLEQRTCVS